MAKLVIWKRAWEELASLSDVEEDCHATIVSNVNIDFSKVIQSNGQRCDYPALSIGSYSAGLMPIELRMTYGEAEVLLEKIRLVLEEYRKTKNEDICPFWIPPVDPDENKGGCEVKAVECAHKWWGDYHNCEYYRKRMNYMGR